MDEPVAATDFSASEELGTPAGKNVVSQLLYEHNYRRRKPQKKRTMGQHADRNAQFENIAERKRAHLAAGQPVISIDSKKKELLGSFYRDGMTDAVDPTIVNAGLSEILCQAEFASIGG